MNDHPEETPPGEVAAQADPADAANAHASSRFHWNLGGWIGAQFGTTCWMVILAILVLETDALVAAVCGGCFLALNIVGLVLWSRREVLSPYAGIQGLVGAAAVANAVVVFFVRSSEKLAELPEGSTVSTDVPWAVLGIAPLLMLMLSFQKRAHDRRLAGLANEADEPEDASRP